MSIKWSDAVKKYGKRVKKGTKEYEECKELYNKMKEEGTKKEKIEEIHNLITEKKEEPKPKKKSVVELLKILKNKKN